MANQSSTVATRPNGGDVAELPSPASRVLGHSTVGDVERFEQAVTIPVIYQYSIPRYNQAPKVMLTSDAYDYLNRTMGVQIWRPEWVHDERGERVRNPIHRDDYIYIRLIGVYRNDLGQLVSYSEDVEVDFKLVWMDARINSRSARVEVDDDGQPKFNSVGMPIVRLDPDDEKRALKALSQLRTFGLRYAQTVAKTRILKVVSGIRTLPIPQPQPFTVRVVGYKDNMSPDERVKQAEKDMSAMFGPVKAVGQAGGLSPDEMEAMRDIEGLDSTEDLERGLVDAAIANSDEQHDIQAQEAHEGSIRRVGPQEFLDNDDASFGLGETNRDN